MCLEATFYHVILSWITKSRDENLVFTLCTHDADPRLVQVTAITTRNEDESRSLAACVSSNWAFGNVLNEVVEFVERINADDSMDTEYRYSTKCGEPVSARIILIKRPLREEPEQRGVEPESRSNGAEQARASMEELFGSDAESEGGEEHVEGDNS